MSKDRVHNDCTRHSNYQFVCKVIPCLAIYRGIMNPAYIVSLHIRLQINP
jgi:hypothetical protein